MEASIILESFWGNAFKGWDESEPSWLALIVNASWVVHWCHDEWCRYAARLGAEVVVASPGRAWACDGMRASWVGACREHGLVFLSIMRL